MDLRALPADFRDADFLDAFFAVDFPLRFAVERPPLAVLRDEAARVRDAARFRAAFFGDDFAVFARAIVSGANPASVSPCAVSPIAVAVSGIRTSSFG
ncbi:MAG TPA: hypothetical protein VL484_14100 [Vicinamibacterales bacterium]|nr:hypothetical protein [Vicinamibacterales bacterium]